MKEKQTELNLILSTDYTHKQGDVLESVRQRVEVSSLYLHSLFGFIKRSAILVEDELSRCSEDETVKSFGYDLVNFSNLGESLVDSIRAATCDLTELQTADEAENAKIETPKVETLAEKISFLVTSEDVPAEISDALSDALTDILNASKSREVLEYEKSAEYIARVLSDYEQSND